MLGRQRRVRVLGLLIRHATRTVHATRTALLIAAVAVGLLAGGCGSDQQAASQLALPPPQPLPSGTTTPEPEMPSGNDSPRDSAGDASAEPDLTPAPRQKSTRLLSATDKVSFRELQAQLGGRAAIAVSSTGFGDRVEQTGSPRTAVAWSTSKVPLAMAIYAAGLDSAQQENLRAAITESDNAAAQALWDALGSGDRAAQAADGALRAAGDNNTMIQPQMMRPGFTPFGQTDWALDDQTRFVAGMPCLTQGQQVLELMAQVIPSERWGLSAIDPSARFKGGWGPGTRPGVDGGYVDRQTGIVTISGKPLAISILSVPADGSHDTGAANLTRIAHWASMHVNTGALRSRARCS